ncbi:hypothetical protein D3C79_835780 [compost metagenome]
MINRHTCGNQQAHGVDVAAFGCRYQRGAAVAVGAGEVGAVGQGQFEDVVVATGTGVQVGAVFDGILGVDVGAGVDQHPGGFDLVVVGGQQQRGTAHFVAGFTVRALVEQAAHLCGLALFGCAAQLAFEGAAVGAGGQRGEHGKYHGKVSGQAFKEHGSTSWWAIARWVGPC